VKTVYLAGPITGLTYGECTDWRQHAIAELAKDNIKGLSPMRGKEYLEAISKDVALTADGDKYKIVSPLSTNKGIITRDRWDSSRCDVLLVNFLGSKIVSIGTVMEVAWADARRTPIVCAVEEDNVHFVHGMMKEAIGFRTDTLEAAIDLVKAILR
jgi:nucleoside 2-deoxyribosyltransferase